MAVTLRVEPARVVQLIRDERVKAVTLTGSEGAGRAVAATAGGQIKKSVMELGGSDPFIVMPSADLEAAATTAVRARVLNNGQSCIAGKRFIAHADIYDEFAALFAAKMTALTVGDPLDEAVDVGPIATAGGQGLSGAGGFGGGGSTSAITTSTAGTSSYGSGYAQSQTSGYAGGNVSGYGGRTH